MKLKLFFSFSLIFLFGFAPNNQSVSKKIAQNNNRFGLDIYKHLSKKATGNIFISPFSISTALSMTYAGADNQTAKEIQQTFYFEDNTPVFHSNYGNYLNTLLVNADGAIDLNIANRLWGEQSFTFLNDFIEINKKDYQSPLEKVDFFLNPENSRQVINNWVSNQTHQKIKDLIPKGSINSETKLVLTNAIYFKGDWKYQFKEKNTKEKTFNLEDGTTTKASFMQRTMPLEYLETLDFQMVRIPYKGDKHSMLVVLPKEGVTLSSVEDSLHSKVVHYTSSGYMPEINLELPKFKMTIPLKLTTVLKDMGMSSAFDRGRAEFSKMSSERRLFISDVVHKAFIDVNEEGTEAAAATAVVMKAESEIGNQRTKPIDFIANRPFVFFIVDNETSAILFVGRVATPKGR